MPVHPHERLAGGACVILPRSALRLDASSPASRLRPCGWGRPYPRCSWGNRAGPGSTNYQFSVHRRSTPSPRSRQSFLRRRAGRAAHPAIAGFRTRSSARGRARFPGCHLLRCRLAIAPFCEALGRPAADALTPILAADLPRAAWPYIDFEMTVLVAQAEVVAHGTDFAAANVSALVPRARPSAGLGRSERDPPSPTVAAPVRALSVISLAVSCVCVRGRIGGTLTRRPSNILMPGS